MIGGLTGIIYNLSSSGTNPAANKENKNKDNQTFQIPPPRSRLTLKQQIKKRREIARKFDRKYGGEIKWSNEFQESLEEKYKRVGLGELDVDEKE